MISSSASLHSLTEGLSFNLYSFWPKLWDPMLTKCSMSLVRKRDHLKHLRLGLPSWLSEKESAYQCRRHRLDPWSGKIPHATGQLSQWATTSEPELWSLQVATIKPTLHDYWSHGTFEPVPWNKSSPCNGEALKPQLEKDCAQQQRPSATKKKKKKSKLKNALYSHADVCIDITHTSICMP